MNEELFAAYMNGDVSGEEIMDEYGEKYPDLQLIWGWLKDQCMALLAENHEANEDGDDKRAASALTRYAGANDLSVKACDEVFARIKDEEREAEEKFVKWCFKVEVH